MNDERMDVRSTSYMVCGAFLSMYENGNDKVSYLIVSFLVCLGSISAETGPAMFGVLARHSPAKIPMVRTNDSDMMQECTKKVQ